MTRSFLIVFVVCTASCLVACTAPQVQYEGWTPTQKLNEEPGGERPSLSPQAGLVPPSDDAILKQPPTTAKAPRAPSAMGDQKPFANGLKVLATNCYMKERPQADSQPAGYMVKGKEVWVDWVDERWAKVYKEAGPAYISTSCLPD